MSALDVTPEQAQIADDAANDAAQALVEGAKAGVSNVVDPSAAFVALTPESLATARNAMKGILLGAARHIQGAGPASDADLGTVLLSSAPGDPDEPTALNAEEVSATPGAGLVPRAGAGGKLDAGWVDISPEDIGAADAVHTHAASDVTDFASAAAAAAPVQSVNGQTGAVVIETGGGTRSIATVTGATTLDGSKDLILLTTVAAPYTVTLPSAASFGQGKVLTVKDVSRTLWANGPVRVAAAGSDRIDGVARVLLLDDDERLDLVSTGSAWVSLSGEVCPDPLLVGTPWLWLDGMRGVTLEENSRVATAWEDTQSGSGKVFTASGSPLWVPGRRPLIGFTGGSTFTRASTGIQAGPRLVAAAVALSNWAVNSHQALFGYGENAGDDQYFRVKASSGQYGYFAETGSAAVIHIWGSQSSGAGVPLSPGSLNAIVCYGHSGGRGSWFNGIESIGTASTSPSDYTARDDVFRVGGRAGGADPMTGNTGDLIIFDDVTPSVDDIEILNRYLLAKYRGCA